MSHSGRTSRRTGGNDYEQLAQPNPDADLTLERDGVTSIETKRWLMGTLFADDEEEFVTESAKGRVGSD